MSWNAERRPAACVVVKMGIAWVADVCRQRGAISVIDGIDNYRLFDRGALQHPDYSVWDAYVTQTVSHAEFLAHHYNRSTAVVPHPHGNLASWGVAERVRPRIRAVGFVYQDTKNLPDEEDLVQIATACCRLGASLYLVSNQLHGSVPVGLTIGRAADHLKYMKHCLRVELRTRNEQRGAGGSPRLTERRCVDRRQF